MELRKEERADLLAEIVNKIIDVQPEWKLVEGNQKERERCKNSAWVATTERLVLETKLGNLFLRVNNGGVEKTLEVFENGQLLEVFREEYECPKLKNLLEEVFTCAYLPQQWKAKTMRDRYQKIRESLRACDKTAFEKPITYIITYRGVDEYKKGVYRGNKRDVIIVGDELSGLMIDNRGNDRGGESKVSKEKAAKAFEKAEEEMAGFSQNADRAYIYLGAEGAKAGFEYLDRLKGRMDVKLVACDCKSDVKIEFAGKHGLQIIWSECGGVKTLAEIVKKELYS